MTMIEEEAPDKGPPDFLFICCSTCWTARDPQVPVLLRGVYEADAMRHRTFTCQTCSAVQKRQVDAFPTLVGLWMQDAMIVREGTYAPDAETVFMPGRWGIQAPREPERGSV